MQICTASISINIIERKRSWNRVVAYPVCRSVSPEVYCGKTGDWIRMPFPVVSGVGRGMGVLDKGGDRRRGRGSSVGEFGTSNYNQLGRRRALPKLLWGGLIFLVIVQ